MIPGIRLRRLAERFCRSEVVTRLIDPVIADLQYEYLEARRRNQKWRSRWVRVAGSIAFWKVLVRHTGRSVAAAGAASVRVESGAIARVLAISALIGTVVSAILLLPPLLAMHRAHTRVPFPGAAEAGWLIVYLIPQALGVAIPIAAPFGILVGLRGRAPSAGTRRTLVLLTLLAAPGEWLIANTLVPRANQAFRELVWVEVRGRPIEAGERVWHSSVLARGADELTLSELSARIDVVRRVLRDDSTNLAATAELSPLLRSFYMRWVLALAPLVLGLFAIAVCSWDEAPAISMAIGFIVVVVYIAFYTVLSPAKYWVPSGPITPLANALIPNLAVMSLAVFLAFRSRIRL